MSESFRATPPEQQWSGTSRSGGGNGNGFQNPFKGDRDGSEDTGDVGKTLLVGVLGGLLSAAGYLIYRRLPDEQKERLHHQVRSQVQQRIAEIRQNFNV